MIELAALLLEKNNELWHIHSWGLAQLVISCVIIISFCAHFSVKLPQLTKPTGHTVIILYYLSLQIHHLCLLLSEE